MLIFCTISRSSERIVTRTTHRAAVVVVVPLKRVPTIEEVGGTYSACISTPIQWWYAFIKDTPVGRALIYVQIDNNDMLKEYI